MLVNKTIPIISLPKNVSLPSENLSDYSILLYGEKKIGKTTLASQFEKAFFLMCEPGGKALKIYQRPVNNWEEFKKYINLALNSEFRTIVIDPIDLAYKMCLDYICKEMLIDHPADEKWGKGWNAIRDEFTKEINKLLHAKGVILISHATESEIKTRTGITYHKLSPTMSGQARDILEGVVDIWAYYGYDNKNRILTILGDDHVGAGHRLENRFEYKDGSPIREIPMGTNSKEAYINFIKAFENQLEKGGTKSEQIKKKFLVIKKKH